MNSRPNTSGDCDWLRWTKAWEREDGGRSSDAVASEWRRRTGTVDGAGTGNERASDLEPLKQIHIDGAFSTCSFSSSSNSSSCASSVLFFGWCDHIAVPPRRHKQGVRPGGDGSHRSTSEHGRARLWRRRANTPDTYTGGGSRVSESDALAGQPRKPTWILVHYYIRARANGWHHSAPALQSAACLSRPSTINRLKTDPGRIPEQSKCIS